MRVSAAGPVLDPETTAVLCAVHGSVQHRELRLVSRAVKCSCGFYTVGVNERVSHVEARL